MMTILGLILATVGEGALFNMPRFTHGADGPAIGDLSFITLAMAMFALPEAMFLVLNPARGANGDSGQGKITNLRFSREEARRWPR
jgi:putative tricarboxylic transport membrane protein